MSNNPLAKLRQLIQPVGASHGVVISITGELISIATPQGLAEYGNPGGFTIGESVNIENGRLSKRIVGGVYWM